METSEDMEIFVSIRQADVTELCPLWRHEIDEALGLNPSNAMWFPCFLFNLKVNIIHYGKSMQINNHCEKTWE